MQIIHLILGKANPNRLNGVNKVVYHLASEQVKYGHQAEVWGVTKDIQHNYPARIFKTRLFKANINPFVIDNELKKAICLRENTIFHLHGGWIPLYFSLAIFLNKYAKPFILTPHGAYNTIAMKQNSFMKQVYFKFFELKLLQYADKIHCIGQSEVEGLEKIFKNEKSVLIPYGFDFTVQEYRQIQKDHFIIGYMGRLDVYTKGLDLILNAFQQFQKVYPNTQLWIIGSGEGKDWIENYCRQNYLKNVVLWGPKFGDEKNDLIKQLSVFLHPSRNEGLPTAVLEVASFGIPSVVSEATNVAKYVQKYGAGISVPNESSIHIFDAIKCILENRGRYDYKANCHEMLIHEFSWKRLINEFDKLYT